MLAGISGQDSLVVLPTGGGKSLCHQVPRASMDGMAVVISPLISLMKDQVDALRRTACRLMLINSTLSPDEKRAIANDIAEQRVKPLYVAPERLSLQGLLDLLASVQVSFLRSMSACTASRCGVTTSARIIGS
ncbi:MAG: DEAD/DEAH box helicase [Planctomycetaceae bacterium]